MLDEYLGGFLSLEQFASDAKAPGNLQDYLPMLDFCRDQGLGVLAANCPRRYTKMVREHNIS